MNTELAQEVRKLRYTLIAGIVFAGLLYFGLSPRYQVVASEDGMVVHRVNLRTGAVGLFYLQQSGLEQRDLEGIAQFYPVSKLEGRAWR